MTYQGTQTISRTVDQLIEEFGEMGFDYDSVDGAAKLRSMIYESDVVGDRDTDVWVEAAASQPGDLKKYPHLVYCVLDLNTPNAVTAKTYKPVS